jgi:hypothetical protein
MDATKLIGYAVDAVLFVVVFAILFFALRSCMGGAVDAIQAPAKLDAAIGANAALKAAGDTQNAAFDALKADSDARIAKSTAAVKDAGKPNFAAAKRIQESKPAGTTPVERAANLINAEFAK